MISLVLIVLNVRDGTESKYPSIVFHDNISYVKQSTFLSYFPSFSVTINTTNKLGQEVIKHCSCSTKLSMKFIMFIESGIKCSMKFIMFIESGIKCSI